MMSEKIELLGKDLYADIPAELTIKSIPTLNELEYVGAEDFNKVMIDKIFPKVIEESINFHNLLEFDFHWICRCLRILNYGPYFTVNKIFCEDCESISSGEYTVDLRTVNCIPIPSTFKGTHVIAKGELLDFDKEITLSLLTVQDGINAAKDKIFAGPDGKINESYARLCYQIKKIGTEQNLTPIQVKLILEKELSSADYMMLKQIASESLDFGLRAGGSCQCPKCHGNKGAFVALVGERFFRPTMGDLRRWRDDSSRKSAKK